MIDGVLNKLEHVKRNGSGWIASCPVPSHGQGRGDHHPSLSISEGSDGRVLLKCHAGCSTQEIVAAMGLEMSDLFPDGEMPVKAVLGSKAQADANADGNGKHVETTYRLVDADGELVAEHVRIDKPGGKKSMFWRRNGKNGLRGLSVADLPLYGLPHLLAADHGETVITTEGEKAAQALLDAGLVAVGTVTGASSAPGDKALKPLSGRRVVFWPDNDEPGRDHMQRIARKLTKMGCNVSIIDWPEAPEHGDAADFLEQHNAEDVERLLAQAEPYVDPLDETRFDLSLPATLQDEERVFLDNILCAGDLLLHAGHEKQFKSTLLLQLCVCLAAQRPFLSFEVFEPTKVLYIDAESKTNDLSKRWQGIKPHLADDEIERVVENLTIIEGRKLFATGHSLAIDDEKRLLEEIVEAHADAQLIVLDPLRLFYWGDENQSDRIADAILRIRQLADGRAVIVVHHVRKRPGARRDQFHLRDDPAAWSDNIRGSGALKAHVDGMILQELRDDERAGEVLDFAGIFRSFPSIQPMPLVASESSFAWHERLADQDCDIAVERLKDNEREVFQHVQRLLAQGTHGRASLVRQLVNDGVRKQAMAYRLVGRLIREGILVEHDDGRVSVSGGAK